MSASIPRLAAREPTEEIVAGLREHGAVIVEGVLAPDLLARFNAEIDPILEQVSPKRSYLNPVIDYFYGDCVRQITGVATRSRVFGEEILCHPLVYLGSTIHAGGRNATADGWRRGMHMSFVVGWLRTEDNNYLSTPPDVARTLPRRSQELLGYAAHDAIAVGGGYLGTVDLLDPIELLALGKL